MVNSAYAKAAVQALVNWNGKSLDEAQEIVSTHSREEIEGMCWAEGSVKAGFDTLVTFLQSRGEEISDNQKQALYAVILDGPEDSDLTKEFASRLSGVDRDGLALDALTAIHDKWVTGAQKKFADPGRAARQYMHTPLETIGWDTVYSDYIFLKPVMESMGIPIEDEQRLISRYGDRQVEYFSEHGITDRDSLERHIGTLPTSYPAIGEYSEENKAKFANNSELTEQVYEKSGFEKLNDKIIDKAPTGLAEKVTELKGLLEEKLALEQVPVNDINKDVNKQDHGE